MSSKRMTKQELRAIAKARLAQPISKDADPRAVDFKAGIILAIAASEQRAAERAA